MDNDLHDIDKIFFNSLEPNEENPSEKVWDKINKKLDDEGSKKTGAWYVWAKRSLLLLLIAGLGFAGYQYFHKKTSAIPQENITTTKQDNLPLPLGNDNLKKEKIKVDDKTAFDNTSVSKSDIKNVLPKDENKLSDTTTGLKNTTTNSSTKKTRLINTKQVNAIADSKNITDTTKQNINNKAAISLTNNATLDNKISIKEITSSTTKQDLNNKNIVALKTNKPIKNKINTNKNPNSYFSINKKGIINTTDKNSHYLSDVNSNGNKKNNIVSQKNKSNIDFPIDATRQLNAKTAVCNINDISTSQPLSALNLPRIETGHLPSFHSEKDSTSKKTTSKKQTFSTKSRFYISAFAAPEWQGYQLKDNDDQPNGGIQNQGQDTKNKIKHREDEDASLVAGLGIGYRLSKKLSIESGLRYSEYDIRTDTVKLYAAFNTTTNTVGYKINTSLGYGYLNNATGTAPAIGDSMVANNLRQSVNYLSMPLLLRYQTGKGRLSFNPGLGFVFNFILNSNIRTNIGNGQKQMIHLQGLKKIWVGMMFTPAAYYRLNNRISFGLEPYFNYTISPINKATVVDSYPYGIGLGASVRYHF